MGIRILEKYYNLTIETATYGDNVDSPEKKAQETFSLRNTGDSFRKIVVLDGSSKYWTDEDGVTHVGVIPFLLEDILSDLL